MSGEVSGWDNVVSVGQESPGHNLAPGFLGLVFLGSSRVACSLYPSWAASRTMYNHVCCGLLIAFLRFVCVFYLFLFIFIYLFFCF